MFVRIKSTPNSPRKSVQIVDSIRYGNKVRQKIIRHVGVGQDEDELSRLQELGAFIKAKLENENQLSFFPPEEVFKQVIESKLRHCNKPLKVDIKKLREDQRVIVGIHEVYGTMYKELGLDRILPVSRYHSSHWVLFHTVMARIANPQSKRESSRFLEEDFGVRISLEKIYRMMDRLDSKRLDKIKRLAGQAAQKVFKEPLKVLFFDCTTLYFESVIEDDLRQRGYSKDAKFKESQVCLAVVVTKEGFPVSYEVFPGAIFEGHTLNPVIKEMKSKYNLEQAIYVADRGMLSEDNLKALEDENLHYIVGAKLKKLPKVKQEFVLDKSKYKIVNKQKGFKIQSLADKDNKRKVIVGYSHKRAEKDRHDRQQTIDSLVKKLSKAQDVKTLLNNYGYKKYLKVTGKKQKLSVNESRVKEDQKWDGLFGVITNLKDMDDLDIIGQYKGLWQVEETFRIAKTDLKIRPIFHWTSDRIKAHIAIAFMCLVCIRHLAYRIKIQYQACSPEVIRNALIHAQHSLLVDQTNNNKYSIPSNISKEALKIYQIMGLKHSTTPYLIE